MKLGKSALLEIVSIVQEGLLKGQDISQKLRELDLVPTSGSVEAPGDVLELSVEYVAANPRAEDWEEID